MVSYGLRNSLDAEQRLQFDAMHALIVQNKMAYSRAAKLRGVATNDSEHDWFISTDDEFLKGWQSSLSALMHTFGESLLSVVRSNKAASAAVSLSGGKL